MSEKPQPNRWRCLASGCNPVLDQSSAEAHKTQTGHRVAKWPVRSAEGQKKARQRNKSGYYDKYNVGSKGFHARGLGGFVDTSSSSRYTEGPEETFWDDDDGSWDAHSCFTG